MRSKHRLEAAQRVALPSHAPGVKGLRGGHRLSAKTGKRWSRLCDLLRPCGAISAAGRSAATPLSHPFNRAQAGRRISPRPLRSRSSHVRIGRARNPYDTHPCTRLQIRTEQQRQDAGSAGERHRVQAPAGRGGHRADGAFGAAAGVRLHRRVRAAAFRRGGPRHRGRPPLDARSVLTHNICVDIATNPKSGLSVLAFAVHEDCLFNRVRRSDSPLIETPNVPKY